MKTLQDYKVDRKRVMVKALGLVNMLGYTLSEALKIAWQREKARRMGVFFDLSDADRNLINSKKRIISYIHGNSNLSNSYN